MESRMQSRKALAATVCQNFQPTDPLIAHFDGKLLRDLDGNKYDCLPIIMSSLDVEKLLGIPMLPVGTGSIMGQKVLEFVIEWPGVEEQLPVFALTQLRATLAYTQEPSLLCSKHSIGVYCFSHVASFARDQRSSSVRCLYPLKGTRD